MGREGRERGPDLTGGVGGAHKEEVDYERFMSHYWPRLSPCLPKGLDGALVFKEIISHVKGSQAAVHNPKGHLEREQYLRLGGARWSMLDGGQREVVYEAFEHYERMKRERGEYDICDFVYHVLKGLEGEGYAGPNMHYVYVDEVQDLTEAQICVLKHVCEDHRSGFLFAGDTAQTIARGVDFRFQDVKNVFYAQFLGKESEIGEGKMKRSHKVSRSIHSRDGGEREKEMMRAEHVSAPKNDPQKAGGTGEASWVPDMFHLAQNFRTHNNIVQVADNIVKLLHHFFPFSVDRLETEFSLVGGGKPVFLEGRLTGNLFERGSGSVGSGGCDFGAEQVS